MEGQYYIDLWAAHMLLEYGETDKFEIQIPLKIIREYAQNAQSPEVALEEKVWVSLNGAKYTQ